MHRISLAAITILALSIASVSAQVSGVIEDSPRDGVPDLVSVGLSTLIAGQGREARFVNEFELPPRPRDGYYFLHIACVTWTTPDPRPATIEFSFYEADGVITLDDFDRAPLATREFPLAAEWASAEIRFDVAPIINALVDAGTRQIGIRVRIAAPFERPPIDLSLTRGRLLDVGQDCSVFVADYDRSGGVDLDDIFAFFMDWEAGRPCADVDRSGGIDGDDFAYLFGQWCCG